MTHEHDADFHAWTQEQARLLRARRFAEIDADRLAEEIESMGARDRRELFSRLVNLLHHLLKWLFQPARRCKSWRRTIRHHRYEIAWLLRASPSLRPALAAVLPEAYARARLEAAEETELPLKTFPKDPPFTLAEALDPLFPDDLGGPEREAAEDGSVSVWQFEDE